MILNPGDIAIDYSFARPTPAAIVAAGVRLVCRYISPTRTSLKNLTPAERDALLAAGLSILLVWENASTDPLKGATLGDQHGKLAGDFARSLGYPVGFPIIIAVDFDTQLGQVETILDYCRAFTTVSGYPSGIYGEADIVSVAALRGISTFGWQTTAWSHKAISPQAHCLQHATPVHPSVPLLGAVDDNTVLKTFKAWSLAPDPQPVPEDDMPSVVLTVTDLPGQYLWTPGSDPIPFTNPADRDALTAGLSATSATITKDMYDRLFIAPVTVTVPPIEVPPATIAAMHVALDIGDKGHISGTIG